MFAKSVATAVGAAALFAQANAQVTATGTMVSKIEESQKSSQADILSQGSTNPPQATMGTPVNQTSMARLISANSVGTFAGGLCIIFGDSRTDIAFSRVFRQMTSVSLDHPRQVSLSVILRLMKSLGAFNHVMTLVSSPTVSSKQSTLSRRHSTSRSRAGEISQN